MVLFNNHICFLIKLLLIVYSQKKKQGKAPKQDCIKRLRCLKILNWRNIVQIVRQTDTEDIHKLCLESGYISVIQEHNKILKGKLCELFKFYFCRGACNSNMNEIVAHINLLPRSKAIQLK